MLHTSLTKLFYISLPVAMVRYTKVQNWRRAPNDKISTLLGEHPPHWQSALGQMLAQGQALDIF